MHWTGFIGVETARPNWSSQIWLDQMYYLVLDLFRHQWLSLATKHPQSDVCRDSHRKESLNSRMWWEKYWPGPHSSNFGTVSTPHLLWHCSCYSRLFISVHLQRCTVLQLYERHDGCNNCRSTVCLYQRQCYSGCMQLSRWVMVFHQQWYWL